MALVQRVLFPVDFSDRCTGAARHVEAIAGRFEADVTMMHVDSVPDYAWGVPEVYDYKTWLELQSIHKKRLRERLDGYLADEMKFLRTKRVLCEGDPARRIVEHAQANRVDLIMMPSHGAGPFRRYVLGSVTAKVLHDATCPVWTSAHAEEAPRLEDIHVRKVLCALDLGAESHETLSWAGRFAEEYQAELAIVHALPPEPPRPASYMDAEYRAVLTKNAQVAIAELQGRAETKASVVIEPGTPAELIAEVAEREQADVVVIGRGAAAGGLGRLRAHAYSIIRSAPCPVVSV